MVQDVDLFGQTPRFWKWFFGVKLVFDLVISGIFYFEHSIALFWRLSFIVFSTAVFLLVYLSYSNTNKNPNWLIYLLILDFLVSASYGYIFIAGNFPNHLFIGITALAILMFIRSTRVLIAAGFVLLLLYVATMGSIDWYLYKRLDADSYFITCSFIVFACIVKALIHFYQRARREALELYAKLQQSHEQLENYASKAEEWAASRERVRIAREIHDTVGHKLTAALVQMQAARKLSQVDPSRSDQAYLDSEGLIRSSLQEVRLSVRAILDEPIQSTSLNESLERLSREFTKFANVSTSFQSNGTPVALPSNLQLTAYRIVQESLTNAQKHGHASHAEILLSYSESGFALAIRNDGEMPAELKPGFGLINLQERVKEWNGQVRFQLDPASGFAVEARFPYPSTDMERGYR
ncbi:sensor histidine kinase YfiJ [Paenibacillus glycanilyticus]|uniref:histidine kinase n=1 Tax=Paenibacillus glycanilyticus TaxID=126569 RepID=A0ABQ6NRD8_9BACL|nr:sensor histidine kinase [Paenibacillus glycanilyticus]GMK47110.1 sensor histidine kinase YfiJ [Paenibacillus glycanilyticus]